MNFIKTGINIDQMLPYTVNFNSTLLLYDISPTPFFTQNFQIQYQTFSLHLIKLKL